MRLLRFTRLARMARLLRSIPELLIIVRAIAIALRSVPWHVIEHQNTPAPNSAIRLVDLLLGQFHILRSPSSA